MTLSLEDSASPSYYIKYSPTGRLYFEFSHGVPLPRGLSAIHDAFSEDWRAGWFRLASDKLRTHEPTLAYWQAISGHLLTQLCHLPNDTREVKVQPLDIALSIEWRLRAPPMIGGEYLSQETLSVLWDQLYQWVDTSAKKEGGFQSFLEKYAPHWQKVGQVSFHLAENKKDNDKPFAFLATYTTGFNSEGNLKHLPLKEALRQHSDSSNRQGLIKLLTPVQKASEVCPWVGELMASGEIYQPLAWNPQQAYAFLNSISRLEESGLSVRIPNWWKKRLKPQVSVSIGSSKSVMGTDALLDFNAQIVIGDQALSEEELSTILSTNQKLLFLRGQWVEVDSERLKEALAHWKLVQKQNKNGQLSFIEGMRLLAGTSTSLEIFEEDEERNNWVRITAGESLAQTLQQLRNPKAITSKDIQGLNATLRPYQHEGVSWLALLSSLGLGACLADDMGLGKTIQILSLLLLKQQQEGENGFPSLLIVPASLLSNWQKESSHFAPSLKLFLLHPSELKGVHLSKIEQNLDLYLEGVDLVVTTYSMLIKLDWLEKIQWKVLILDEAQAIKNSNTKQSKAIKSLQSKSKIALTGTPIENRLSDLWSLFDFLNPGLLGSPKVFKTYINHLQAQPNRFDSLRKLTSPYILRRMKTDPKVISDLPDKVETVAYCQLSLKQIQLYQAIVEELRKMISMVEPTSRRGAVLKALLQLKQVCNHPAQCAGTGNYTPSESGKFIRLREICEEIQMRQEKVLVFTQFSEIIPYLQDYLQEIFGRKGLNLHGGTSMKERKELVDLFQNKEGPPFFILSLKAGGTGLTLTEASHVIHFDRWWNPAVENQATDRAFRIGQKKNVLVHKFITQGTVEEKIDELISSKKTLSSEILSSSEDIRITEMSNEDLLNLISLDINKSML